jgi:hypothetical protein
VSGVNSGCNSPDHGQLCQVIETHTLLGETTCRVCLSQVRDYRLDLLAQEERTFQEQLDRKAHAYPEMVPLLAIRVEGDGHE